jgi:hypothetical protein
MIIGYSWAALWFDSQVLQPRPIARLPTPISRASLRRAVPSFTVEVLRRPRLATKASQDLQLLETKTQPTAFESESHRLAALTFGAPKTPNQSSGDGAASYPQRRILPSLVPENPPGGQPQDAFLSAGALHPMSRAQKPTSAAPIKGKDHMSASLRNLEASSELTAQRADKSSDGSGRSSAPSSDGIAVSSGVPTATANDFVVDTGGRAPRPMAKPKVRVPIALDGHPVPGAAKDRGFITRTDALGALPTAVDDVSRPKRKRTIMGRYVFGDELKPGERWKRRLVKGR